MARKNYTVEQIVVKLREVELLCGQGKTIEEACRQSNITQQAYYRDDIFCSFGSSAFLCL